LSDRKDYYQYQRHNAHARNAKPKPGIHIHPILEFLKLKLNPIIRKYKVFARPLIFFFFKFALINSNLVFMFQMIHLLSKASKLA
jgi:hypothetical protein